MPPVFETVYKYTDSTFEIYIFPTLLVSFFIIGMFLFVHRLMRPEFWIPMNGQSKGKSFYQILISLILLATFGYFVIFNEIPYTVTHYRSAKSQSCKVVSGWVSNFKTEKTGKLTWRAYFDISGITVNANNIGMNKREVQERIENSYARLCIYPDDHRVLKMEIADSRTFYNIKDLPEIAIKKCTEGSMYIADIGEKWKATDDDPTSKLPKAHLEAVELKAPFHFEVKCEIGGYAIRKMHFEVQKSNVEWTIKDLL